MSSHRIATRYAKALLILSGHDTGKAKQQLETLGVVEELFNLEDSGRVMRSPVMPLDLKQSLLSYALTQAGRSGTELDQFLQALLKAGRIGMLPDVISAYTRLLNEAEGLAEAELISAVPLPEGEVKNIKTAVSKVLGKQVTIKPTIDKAILGGFVVRAGNYLVDLSLKTKLDGLANSAVRATV